MDKYTVDLDQVLNDFEYSELTDHYSNASARNTAGATPSPSQNNITKHSINNVFHSLNEYLNTNISVDNLNPIDNNPIENKENCLDVKVVKPNNIYRDREKSIKDWNSKTDDLFEFSEKVRENINLVEGNSDISGNGNVGDDGETCAEEAVNIWDDTSEKIDDNSLVVVEEEKEKNTEVASKLNEDDSRSEKSEHKALVDVEESKEEVCEESGENICEKTQHESDKTPENESESEDLKPGEKSGSYTEKQEIQEVVNVSETKEEAVGFSEDLDLDDNEINKLLEKLEEEIMEEEGLVMNEKGESRTVSDIGAVEDCEIVKETKGIEEDDKIIEGKRLVEKESSIGQEEEIEESSLIKKSSEKQEDESLDNTEVLTCHTDSEETKEKSNEGLKDSSDLACGDSKEGQEIEQVVTVESEVQREAEAERNETNNAKEVQKENEQPKTLGDPNLSEAEKDISQDSLSRPQNLPLSSERKINLIGDPGSTPYNNVYKEMPRDSDTDYSTSSSPTFSDASTTASTVSIDDVHTANDENRDIQPNPEAEIHSTAPTCEPDNPTSEIQNPTSEIQNPTSEGTDAPSDPAIVASEGDDASESGAVEFYDADLGQGDRSTGVASEDVQVGARTGQVENIGEVNVNAISIGKQWLGKEAPLWIPDSDAMSCLHCDMKFTVLKRRHHCRACGLVLCSKCCHLRFRLEYLDAEARVCNKCHDILNKDTNSSSGSDLSPDQGNSPSHRPNPNNPLEYCSTVSPLQQVAGNNPNPPAIMVPVGVLKRKGQWYKPRMQPAGLLNTSAEVGSNKGKSNKSVMFCDGIRPGSDLTNLDNDFDYNNTRTKKSEKTGVAPAKVNRNLPGVDPDTNTFIPSSETALPPTVIVCKTDISYADCSNNPGVVEMLKNEQLTFAIHVNLYVHSKIISMSCCINKMAWCFSTEGLINVGQDEIVILLEYIDEESFVPKDVFYHINNVYNEAVKGTSVKEMGLSLHNASNFLDSKNHAGFVYVRATFQCLENVIKPKDPYLVGILIHRWETPWAKLFPLRLILRLGAEYRYYPSPIISTRHRESVFVEIGHTIINLLADFRNFSYTLPQIKGLTIHMEDKNTTVTIPANRYDQVIKSMNNSSDHILAFAGIFSVLADSHLVCIQDTQGNENCYSTHAINIHNKPRKVTGASFIVFNGALKSSSGLTAKSNIVEDGLMIQVLPEHMQQIRENLRAMKNHTISCGCVNAASDETVNIVWGENDVNFNIGVVSAIDGMTLSGIPSIRVHNGKNHVCINGSRLIRWTEVFIIKSGDDNPKNQDPVDVSRVSESIAKGACDALVKYLDLLVANNCQKIGIRTTLHVDNVSYLAGSNGTKLPPIYMKSLDDELIPVLHRITTNNLGENTVVLELIFRILNV